MPKVLPVSALLLIDPAPAFIEFVSRYFSATRVYRCVSFAEAMAQVPLGNHHMVICPQRMASRHKYSLLQLNTLHNPCAPFMVTTVQDETSDVQLAIDHGALGFLHGTETPMKVIIIIQRLLSLYRVHAAVEHRTNWVSSFRDQLHKNPIEMKPNRISEMRQDSRLMCTQTLNAIEQSMKAIRCHAGELTADARAHMFEYSH